MKRSALAALLLLLPVLGVGQVYKHVDENGNVTFTDQPPPNSQPVEIRDLNTVAPPPVVEYATEAAPPEEVSINYEVSITSPENDHVVPLGPGNFSVSASVSPSLAAGHSLQLMLNGDPRQGPQTSGSWALTNVFRGANELFVVVQDEKQKELARSAPITVNVFRPRSR